MGPMSYSAALEMAHALLGVPIDCGRAPGDHYHYYQGEISMTDGVVGRHESGRHLCSIAAPLEARGGLEYRGQTRLVQVGEQILR